MKQRFDFEPFDGLVDIYIDGKKAYSGHNARRGHIYLPVTEEVDDFEIKIHDPRIGIEVEFVDGKVVKSGAEPKDVPKKRYFQVSATPRDDE